MGILADWQIEAEKVFTPFTASQHGEGVISYGVSSYGYDVRVASRFQIFSNVAVPGGVIDPKNFKMRMLHDIDLSKPDADGVMQDHILIPPNSFALCHTVEHVRVPRGCLAVIVGKSTYARCAVVVNCTPLEPEWQGFVTIELSNTATLPAKIYGGEGIAQVLLFRNDGMTQAIHDHLLPMMSTAQQKAFGDKLRSMQCRTSYADKKGKYQDQGAEPTAPRIQRGGTGGTGNESRDE